MSIANELSSDIAAALLTAENSTFEELSGRKETVIKVHSVLHELDVAQEERSRHAVAKHIDWDGPS
jgi:hypothetical protein